MTASGRPDSLELSSIIVYARFMQAFGAMCHLVAKDTLGRRRVPPQKWVRLGIIVAAAVFIMTLVGYALDWFSARAAV